MVLTVKAPQVVVGVGALHFFVRQVKSTTMSSADCAVRGRRFCLETVASVEKVLITTRVCG